MTQNNQIQVIQQNEAFSGLIARGSDSITMLELISHVRDMRSDSASAILAVPASVHFNSSIQSSMISKMILAQTTIATATKFIIKQ